MGVSAPDAALNSHQNSGEPRVSPWQRDVLRQAQRLARKRGHMQITMAHIAIVVADSDAAVVRHWRSLGIDVERARRELAPPGVPETSRYGRSFEFHAEAPREIVVTREVADFFTELAGRPSADDTGRPDGAELATTLLTYLGQPLPGSPLLRSVDAPVRRGYDEDAQTAEAVAAAASSTPVVAVRSAEAELPDGQALDQFGRDLTHLAAMGRLDPLVGREREIEAVLRVLRRRTKRNPLLVGEPGVGKTAIVEGVAQRIAEGALGSTRLVSVDLAGMLAGTRYRGEFEERVQDLLDDALHAASPTILFIDEFHLVIRTGAAEGGLDLGSILLAPMARGHIAIIGATTPGEYRRHLRYAGPLMRRVQEIEVAEPTVAEALDILHGVRDRYAEFHAVTIDDSALSAAVALGRRTSGWLPDTALDLLDDACAQARQSADPDAEVTVTTADVDAIMTTRPARPGGIGGLVNRAHALAGDLRGRLSRARP